MIGVSAGARSAIELALRYPDRVTALVLISPGTYAPSSPVSPCTYSAVISGLTIGPGQPA